MEDFGRLLLRPEGRAAGDCESREIRSICQAGLANYSIDGRVQEMGSQNLGGLEHEGEKDR